MNDMSAILDQRWRVRQVELRQHRDLRASADDAIDRELMLPLKRSHDLLERVVVERRCVARRGLAGELRQRGAQPVDADVVDAGARSRAGASPGRHSNR